MKKIENVKEFVEKIDSSKKINPKDLSSDQDLTIAIMNLISIEEHLVFSGAKTEKNSFYDLIPDIRELRKNLMQTIIPSYEGEVWCISKHLLASSMRLMEVGTKQQSLNNSTEAHKLFNQAYDLYCLFWGLNMNMLSSEEVKQITSATPSQSQVFVEKTTKTDFPAQTVLETVIPQDQNNKISKFKAFVRKAVNCCIE